MFVELLDLGDLLIFFEVIREFVEGREEISHLNILLVGAGHF
jgi:hypothetical protein